MAEVDPSSDTGDPETRGLPEPFRSFPPGVGEGLPGAGGDPRDDDDDGGPGRRRARQTDLPGPTYGASFGDLATQIAGTREDLLSARRNEERVLQKQADTQAPKIAGAQAQLEGVATAGRERLATVEAAKPEITAPPSRKLTEFLSPVQGESPEASVLKMIQGLGLLAGSIGGLARGDARGALAGLKGALAGWSEGDAARADRAFKDWQAKTDAALAKWKVEAESYDRWFNNQNLSVEMMMKGFELDAIAHGNEKAVAAARSGRFEEALKFLTDTRKFDSDVETRRLLITQSHADRAERLEETRRHNRETEAIALQNAELRQLLGSQKVEEREQGFKTMRSVLKDMDGLVDALERKSLLPKGTDLVSSLTARKNRMLTPEDPDLRQWSALQGAMVGYERIVYQDKGGRALAVYKSLLEFVDKPPTAEGAHAVIRRMQKYLESGTPVEGAAETLPAGAHREGNDIVSDSGKYIWRNGAWQPK